MARSLLGGEVCGGSSKVAMCNFDLVGRDSCAVYLLTGRRLHFLLYSGSLTVAERKLSRGGFRFLGPISPGVSTKLAGRPLRLQPWPWGPKLNVVHLHQSWLAVPGSMPESLENMKVAVAGAESRK